MKKTYDFSITQQVSEAITIEIVDQAGVPRNLTGYDFKLDCKKTFNDAEPLFTLSSADNTIILDPNNTHRISLAFTHDLTKALYFDKGTYDLLAFLPDKSIVEVLMSGTVTLNRTVTSLD
jgi:hypothetical protein